MMFGKNTHVVETVKRIPPGSVGVEIGVWQGNSSALFLERCQFLHLVDPWSVDPYKVQPEYFQRYKVLVGSAEKQDFKTYYENVYESVKKRFAARPVKIHRRTSAEFFDTFDGLVDWVYIDGMHTFDGCMADLNGSLKIVRRGGFIFGDDYGTKPGVAEAVDAFVAENWFPLQVFAKTQFQISV